MAICGVLLLVPLVFTDAITLAPEWSQPLAPPPPPPPPPPAPTAHTKPATASTRSASRPFVFQQQALPTSGSARVVIVADTFAGPTGFPGVSLTGVPGGVTTGMGMFIGPNDVPRPPDPEPKAVVVEPTRPEPPASPVRISGGVQAAKLVTRVVPEYPAMAKRARVQGIVRLQAVIGPDGRIRDLAVIEGHPLLRQAAIAAVKEWVYRPTILGGQPVPVETTIDVNFVLSN